MTVLDRIALALAIIGGINWGLVGIFQFDLVAWICGLWCIALLFRDDRERA